MVIMRIIYYCSYCGQEFEPYKLNGVHIIRVNFFNSHSWERDLRQFCSDDCRTKWIHSLVDKIGITSIEVMRDKYEDYKKEIKG
jgi:hypothetical protein